MDPVLAVLKKCLPCSLESVVYWFGYWFGLTEDFTW